MPINPKSSKEKSAAAVTGKVWESAGDSDLRASKKVPKGDSSIVRETFSLPPDDSEEIEAVRRRGAVVGVMLNRSEVVRGGIAALKKVDDATFYEIVSSVPKLKSGRRT